MAKYKIIYSREECIGAAACEAVAPKLFKINTDAKADLIGGLKNVSTGKWERIIDENDLEKAKEAAGCCPVFVIEVIDTGVKDVPEKKEVSPEKYSKLFTH